MKTGVFLTVNTVNFDAKSQISIFKEIYNQITNNMNTLF